LSRCMRSGHLRPLSKPLIRTGCRQHWCRSKPVRRKDDL